MKTSTVHFGPLELFTSRSRRLDLTSHSCQGMFGRCGILIFLSSSRFISSLFFFLPIYRCIHKKLKRTVNKLRWTQERRRCEK
ncbi:hypothetical protein OIU77_005420 [Salix suchowensis]|uniref:Transmembrane protein n=1 Tax=Salix suchowensis TaxID=1278906 RepID=A0ABQ9APC7_9ROSI|nr:hypothetical protein OIU77_005420 [Salix suchowensis]